MAIYSVEHSSLCASPSVNDILDLCEATNSQFALWNDRHKKCLMVEASIPPLNEPIFNIFWKEITDEPARSSASN